MTTNHCTCTGRGWCDVHNAIPAGDGTELPPVSTVDLLAALADQHSKARDALALSAPLAIERVALAVTKSWPREKRQQALRAVTGGHPHLNSVIALFAEAAR